VYAKSEAGVSEIAIGVVFFVNTAVIVLAQLPVSRASEGRRRMAVLGLLGVTWAASWLLVPVAGIWLQGAAAAVLLAAAMALFAIGACLHGAVQAPLVAELAGPRLYGRYMALSALSWSVGFALGPAVGAPMPGRLRCGSGRRRSASQAAPARSCSSKRCRGTPGARPSAPRHSPGGHGQAPKLE
jgi:MFS family permease